MRICTIIVIAILNVISFVASADCSGEICSDVYVDRLYIQESGNIFIATSGVETALTCAATAGVYVTLPSSADGASEIYSALLTAQTANKTVSVRVDGSIAGCPIIYITLDRQ